MKVTATTVASLPPTLVKMEDRKRSAGHSIEDIAPPTKRQAINGSSKASAESDMPWKDFIEVSSLATTERFPSSNSDRFHSDSATA